MDLKGLKAVFLGDSITAGYGISSPDKVYHALLKSELLLKEVKNFGINGTRFAHQCGICASYPKNDETDRNSFSRRLSLMDSDADLVVVFGGTNDFGHGDAPIGDFSDMSPETFYGACHYVFSSLINKYPGKVIIAVTPLRRANEKKSPELRGHGTLLTLEDYVNVIKDVCKHYSLPVCDLYNISGIEPYTDEVRERYMPDGLHPNDDGHALIAAKLRVFLENL